VGEVLVGRIMASTHKGIRVSLEFFDDIFIPDNLLFDIAVLYPPNAPLPEIVPFWLAAYFR
jgi:DNA-directed RNA polymerase subunit E'/Rpb7